MKISELFLTVRAENCLYTAGITSVEELCQYGVRDLLGLKNMGKSTVRDIVIALAEKGMNLSENPLNQSRKRQH